MELENVTLVKLASQYCQTFQVGKGVLKKIIRRTYFKFMITY